MVRNGFSYGGQEVVDIILGASQQAVQTEILDYSLQLQSANSLFDFKISRWQGVEWKGNISECENGDDLP